MFLISFQLVDTKMPINVTAIGVVEKVRLIKAGRNLAMLGKAINRAAQYEMDFKEVCSSTLNNTQNDNCYIDIGIITNTGKTSFSSTKRQTNLA